MTVADRRTEAAVVAAVIDLQGNLEEIEVENRRLEWAEREAWSFREDLRLGFPEIALKAIDRAAMDLA